MCLLARVANEAPTSHHACRPSMGMGSCESGTMKHPRAAVVEGDRGGSEVQRSQTGERVFATRIPPQVSIGGGGGGRRSEMASFQLNSSPDPNKWSFRWGSKGQGGSSDRAPLLGLARRARDVRATAANVGGAAPRLPPAKKVVTQESMLGGAFAGSVIPRDCREASQVGRPGAFPRRRGHSDSPGFHFPGRGRGGE